MNLLAQPPGLIVVVVVLLCGTVARLTRLVNKDTITAPARTWIKRRVKAAAGPGVWHKVDDFLVCPWCVSIWVGAAASYVVVWHWDNRFVFASMCLLAASLVTGNLQSREPDNTAEDAESVANLVEAGFTEESAVAAIKHSDLDRLALAADDPTDEALPPPDEVRRKYEALWGRTSQSPGARPARPRNITPKDAP
jgi:hypothetical protein